MNFRAQAGRPPPLPGCSGSEESSPADRGSESVVDFGFGRIKSTDTWDFVVTGHGLDASGGISNRSGTGDTVSR